MKYHERLAGALSERLGADVTVYADRYVVTLEDEATGAHAVTTTPYGVDRRSAVTDEATTDVIRSAASRLRSDIPKYKPEFIEPARAFVARLEGALES